MRYLTKLLGLFALVIVSGAVLLADAAAATSDAPSAKKDLVLKGDAQCTRCHDEGEAYPVLSIAQTRHGVKGDGRTPTCTSCHGDSQSHINNTAGSSPRTLPDVVFRGKHSSDPTVQSASCLSCHQAGKRTLWAGSQHQNHDLACVSCHSVHNKGNDKVLSKATQKEVCFSCHQTQHAETMRTSTHPLAAGKMACSDCHNPHGSEGPKLMAEKTIRDTCFTCHAEKRGPFLYEHPPASDDCMNCHTPHGSTNAPLLVARTPWLCQGCHGDGAPHPGNVYSAASLPGGAVANANTKNSVLNGPTGINRITGQGVALNNPPPQLAMRGCVNCHTQIHGSNHPAGERFVR